MRLDAHVRTDDPTTLALVELDDRGAAAYRFYTEGTAAAGLTTEAALTALPADAAYLHVGTLGLVLEPMADALEALVEERAGRALVMTDPNCRPAIIADAPRYRDRIARVLRGTDVVKVSDEDLAWLAPGVPPAEAARALLAQGPRARAAHPRRRRRAGAARRTARSRVPAPPVDVVDTIGAGDAFSGGWLARWSERGLGRDDLGDRDAVADATALRLPRRRDHLQPRGRAAADPRGAGMSRAGAIRTLLDGPEAEDPRRWSATGSPSPATRPSPTCRARRTARRSRRGRRSWR